MAALLFKLTGVPDDEAAEVRALLDQHGFETYETEAGRFQMSVAAIWLKDKADLPRAKAVLAEYQAERTRQARADYEAQVARGEQPTVRGNLARDPLRVIGYSVAGLVILGLSTIPFLRLMF